MEKQHKRVKLTTTTTFDLAPHEIERLYIYLSLFQYRYLRVPDYNEQLLLKQLKKDFKRFYIELQKQTERDPNNLTLNSIRAFFEIHYTKLKRITDQNETLEC